MHYIAVFPSDWLDLLVADNVLASLRPLPGKLERDRELGVRQPRAHRLGHSREFYCDPVLHRGRAPRRQATLPQDNLPPVEAYLLRLPRPPDDYDVHLDADGRTATSSQWHCGE